MTRKNDADGPERAAAHGPSSSAGPRPAAGGSKRDIRIQRQPAAVAAADARAAGRWSSGADAAGVPRQRSVDGADAAISEGTRIRQLRLENGPQHRWRFAATG